MKQESLNKIKEDLIYRLTQLDNIDIIDRASMMIFINNICGSVEEYEQANKVLRKINKLNLKED